MSFRVFQPSISQLPLWALFNYSTRMLSQYIERVMHHATYEKTESGKYFGSLPVTPGVWSEAENLEQCRTELREVLEEWIVLSLKRGDDLPVVDGCDLNRVAEHA